MQEMDGAAWITPYWVMTLKNALMSVQLVRGALIWTALNVGGKFGPCYQIEKKWIYSNCCLLVNDKLPKNGTNKYLV